MAQRNHGLGRLPAIDPRDAKHPLSLVTPVSVAIRSRAWTTGPVLDQGDSPQCVAYAWSQFLQSAPLMTSVSSPDYETSLYAEAQSLDEFPGPPPDYDGTSVRGGVKALQAEGRVGQYLWSTNTDEIRRYVLTRGPVVVGTDWYDSMFDVKSEFIPLKKSSGIAGGHAWLVYGFSATRNAFRMVNSWGTSWGVKGHAFVRFADLHFLLSSPGGEACSAIERAI